jgi:TolB protein
MHRVALPRRHADAAAVASVALIVALVATAPATATFPGRNGLIAFASDRDPLLQHPQIFSLSVRSGQAKNLSASPTDDRDAVLSPDGRLIAFAHSGADNGIWLMNADGSGQRLLTRGGEHPVWSPDGRTIAFNGPGPGDCPPPGLRCGHTVAVWAVRVDGSALRRLGAASRNASWSPDSRRVALEGGIDPYGDAHGILVMNADGTNARWIASAGAHPAWSPNGRLIAYDAPRAIEVVRPNGTGRRRLAMGASPIWAPGGNRLAYLCGRRTGAPQISALCLIGADGRGRRVIARGVLVSGTTSDNAEAAWSPHGLRLAYARRDGIFAVNLNGRGRTRLARKQKAFSISSFAWSADGRRLLFTQAREYNDLEIYTTPDDGSNVKPLTSNSVDDLQPSWSPDGTRLAFVRVRGRSADIWVMNADGSEQRLVTRNGFDPGWTSDGNRIVFSRYVGPTVEPYSTYAVTVSSGKEEMLVPGGYHGAPSPDGTRLAFLRGPLGELVIASADGSGAMPLTPADTTDSLSWSPDGGTIAFGSHGAPYTIRVDGSGLTPIPVAQPSARSYLFSPDATAFTFSSGTGYPTSQIGVSGVAGSATRVVSATRGRNQDPDWQPLPR